MKIRLTTNQNPNTVTEDIFVRAYPNQDYDEKRASKDPAYETQTFVAEILFRPEIPIEHIRMNGWLPRNVANGIAVTLAKLHKEGKLNGLSICISNEMPYAFDHLTSCGQNFHNAIIRHCKETGIYQYMTGDLNWEEY